MATINKSTTFNIGDKVWLKNLIDQYTGIDPSTETWWIELYIPYMLYKVTEINVKLNSDGITYSEYYTIQILLTQFSTMMDANATGVTIDQTLQNIEVTSLYSFADGQTKIVAKTTDLNSFIASIP